MTGTIKRKPNSHFKETLKAEQKKSMAKHGHRMQNEADRDQKKCTDPQEFRDDNESNF
jgi:hypothetical protein